MPETAESLQTAEMEVQLICKVRLRALLKQLGDIGKLRSRDEFEDHGNNVFSVKTHCGLRAYGWKDGRNFVVSHCTYENEKKLTDSNRHTIQRNMDIYNRSRQS